MVLRLSIAGSGVEYVLEDISSDLGVLGERSGVGRFSIVWFTLWLTAVRGLGRARRLGLRGLERCLLAWGIGDGSDASF